MDSKEKKKALWLWCRDIIIPCVLVYLLFFHFFGLVFVVGPSMSPTYDNGKILIMNRLQRGNVQRGDVVVVSMENSDTGKKLIKRVIGLPGETVYISLDGIVYINGVELNESYAVSPTEPEAVQTYPIIVPEGYIFIMGDNRPHSADSRGTLGVVPLSAVKGVVIGSRR